ncbi:hypothetical protein [Rhizobium straminoryzae]|uniref:Uncharacterized protein n=1 Tax=Rhizobium straminoryzae TaxID=1387186 RepID=A0A549SZJ3_9HYPH|nr:hypothetical protein [Rhizobium straminoryzae]TRL35043.1 hypothetical protein FNA46_21160 [Rhizobium straminoryzae]
MDAQLPHWETDPIGFIVDRLFPDQRIFANEEYWETHPEHKQRFEAANAAAQRFIESIGQILSIEQFDLILESEINRFLEERIEIVNALDAKRFFNNRLAETNWDYWSKISYWTPEEAVAISFGKDPNVVNLQSLQPYAGNSLFVGSFHSQMQLISRAVEAGQLLAKNTPAFFLAWALRTGFHMDPRAIEAVEARGEQIADWKTEFDTLAAFLNSLVEQHGRTEVELRSQAEQAQNELETLREAAFAILEENTELHAKLAELSSDPANQKPTPPRERESMLKLILAMAMKKYQFDPTKLRNSATANIAGSVAQIGLKLDEDTVRKFLSEAKVLLQDKTD